MPSPSNGRTIPNLDEYAYPELYDLENPELTPQGPFYLELARRTSGPALELGCGTGRITIPLARQGVVMTGLDAVSEMLEQAQRKAPDLPIHWVAADARAFELPDVFDLIFATTGAFQHMLERNDQEALLACVRAHLAPNGIFAFDVGFPHPQLMAEAPEEQDWFSYHNDQGNEVRVSGTNHYDALRQVTIETAYRCWHDADGQQIRHRAPLELRHFFPQELEALLHYNGFTLLERYGSFDREPLSAESKEIICVCKMRDE